MRFAHRLTLLAVGTIAATVMIASSASAVSVPIYTEPNTNPPTPCSALVAGDHTYTGGCLINATSLVGSPVELRGIFGVMFLCDTVFTARLNGNGEGFIYNQVARAPGTVNPCTAQPQNEADGHVKPWPLEVTAENGCGVGCYSIEAVFSVTGPFGIIVNCHLNALEFRETSHVAAQVKTSGTTHQFCENDVNNAIQGTWNLTTPAPGMEAS